MSNKFPDYANASQPNLINIPAFVIGWPFGSAVKYTDIPTHCVIFYIRLIDFEKYSELNIYVLLS